MQTHDMGVGTAIRHDYFKYHVQSIESKHKKKRQHLLCLIPFIVDRKIGINCISIRKVTSVIRLLVISSGITMIRQSVQISSKTFQIHNQWRIHGFLAEESKKLKQGATF